MVRRSVFWMGGLVVAALLGGCAGSGAEVRSGLAPPAAAELESGGVMEIHGARFTRPAGWVEEKPANDFRAAQLRLPSGAEGVDDAELVVFYFGAQGAGSVEENLKRWRGHFEGAAADAGEVTREDRGEVALHTLDLTGTYAAETSPGSGVRVRREGWRLLGAILVTRNGEYYLKLLGPAAVVERWAGSFRGFVGSAEVRAVVDPHTTALRSAAP